MMRYKASSYSRFYIRLALSLQGERDKARLFCNFNARCLLRARELFLKLPALVKLDPSQEVGRCVTRNAEACALWVLEGTEIDKDN